MYCCLIFWFKKVVFEPRVVYGLSTEDMNNRLFLSLFKATVTVPPFSLMLQTVVYAFGHFCGESWENEDRENFSSKNLEVVLANKIDNSTKGCIRCKNKSHMGMIHQRRGNFTVAFLWVLTGDSLAPDVCWYVSNGPWGAEVAGEVLQDCATGSQVCCMRGWCCWPKTPRQSKCIDELQNLYCPSVNCAWVRCLPWDHPFTPAG